ncbi:MAG: response regulator transcription factor [Alphaproteobacteria bacterium]|nr:response regulator transcription factor [Alphaproteobacteria bacterium]MBQ3117014.1 response regulator transcription factor [Alphaproteobacteria bacterium]MBQ6853946.1 response regulator transcription factor [Alphaproteobacteria bacterium]MBQ8557582.1 response regulator transcription factor [Alphaproteobacteria bacterium]
MRVLLIEDDKTVSQNIALILKKENMVVDTSYLGEDGIEVAKLYEYDIIILDILLPDMEGYDVLKRLRAAHINTPVLILSGLNTPDKKVKGFGYGADDYLTKPFDRTELIARVNAIVRRTKGHADSIIRTGGMEINLNSKIVTVDGKVLNLTSKEYSLFELLALRKGTTINKEQFLNHLYGGLDEPEMKIIDVFLCKIRRKLEKLTPNEEYIQTVWGRGYILKDLPIREKDTL